MAHTYDPSSYFQQQRIPAPASNTVGSVSATPGSSSFAEQMSPALVPVTQRYEETAFHRNELEAAKKENDALKKRVRDLERMVRERRETDTGRDRSESVSTTASVNISATGGSTIAPPRDSIPSRQERESGATSQASIAIGVPEEEVRVGESASSRRVPNP